MAHEHPNNAMQLTRTAPRTNIEEHLFIKEGVMEHKIGLTAL